MTTVHKIKPALMPSLKRYSTATLVNELINREGIILNKWNSFYYTFTHDPRPFEYALKMVARGCSDFIVQEIESVEPAC